MRTRPALAVAVALSVALGGAATAAPKSKPKPKPVPPVCNQVTDEKGDAAIVRPQSGMDVVSADIATGAKKLVTTIRLAAAPDTVNPEAVGSSRYYFEYTAPGSENPQFLQASIAFGTGAATFRSGEITPSANGTTFTNDPVSDSVTGVVKDNVITITADLAALTRTKITPGSKLSSLTVETFSLAGVLLVPVDDAAGAKAYTAGAPTCLGAV